MRRRLAVAHLAAARLVAACAQEDSCRRLEAGKEREGRCGREAEVRGLRAGRLALGRGRRVLHRVVHGRREQRRRLRRAGRREARARASGAGRV